MTASKGQFIDLFRSDNGRAVLLTLMDECNMIGPVCARRDPETGRLIILDPVESAFRDGQRSVLLFILEQLRPAAQTPAEQQLEAVDEQFRY